MTNIEVYIDDLVIQKCRRFFCVCFYSNAPLFYKNPQMHFSVFAAVLNDFSYYIKFDN